MRGPNRLVVITDLVYAMLIHKPGVALLVALLCIVPVASAGPLDVPGPPLALTAVAVPGGIQLDWQAPVTQGSSTVDAYRVYRVENGTRHLVAETSMTTFTDTPVGGFSAYIVTAVNASGEGLPSNPAPIPYPYCEVVYLTILPFPDIILVLGCLFPLPLPDEPGIHIHDP